MKRVLRTILITSAVLAAGTVGFIFWAVSKDKSQKESLQMSQKEQLDEGDQKAFILSMKDDAKALYFDASKKNVLVFQHSKTFDVAESLANKKRLERLIKRTEPTFEQPIIAYNPFGISENTFYFYFETNSRCSIKYSVCSENEKIPDFTRLVYNGEDGNVTKTHEFTVGGILPGRTNYIILRAYDSDGALVEQRVFSVNGRNATSGAKTQIACVVGRSAEDSTHGLYYVFPKAKAAILTYDNSGYLRGELKTSSFLGKRIVVNGKNTFYQFADNGIVRINAIGQVTGVYRAGNNKILDFDYDGFGNLYCIGSYKGRNLIRIPLASGKATKVMDFPKGISLQGVQLMEQGQAFVSTAKPVGVMKLTNIAGDLGKVSFVLGDKSAWKGTKYKKKVNAPKASLGSDIFLGKCSQNANGYSLEIYTKGKYTLLSMDKKGRKCKGNPSIDWGANGAYGSGQMFEEHFILCDGASGKYGEYDKRKKKRKGFSVGFPIRSALKYTLKGTCFY